MKAKIFGLFALVLILTFSCREESMDGPYEPTVQLLSPVDKSNGVDISPTFTWEAFDPEGNLLTYDFYIGPDSTGLIKEASGLTSPEYTLADYSLKKENTYYWYVYVNNGKQRVRSKLWSFHSIPAPDAPVLTGPTKGAFVRTDLTFSWEPVVAGAGEKLVYEVFFGEEEENLQKIATIDGETSYSYDPSGLEIGKVYYWYVTASDLVNASASEVSSIKKLKTDAPDEPNVPTPVDKSGVYTESTNLAWNDVTDPQGDAVTYDLYFDEVYPPANLVAEGTTSRTFNTGTLEGGKPYYWQVVAKDPAGNFTESRVFSLTRLAVGAPGAPQLADLDVDGMLTLDEVIRWEPVSEPDGQSVTYDVYLGESYPPQTLLEAGLTTTEYQIKNTDMNYDITNVKTLYCMVVAKDPDGNTSNSVPVIFKPQMTGTMTDVRGTESITYPWVRMGTQIWITENLRTRMLTDGTSLVNTTNSIYNKADVNAKFYAEHPAVDGFPSDWFETHGLVYTYALAVEPLMAPEGWHIATPREAEIMMTYANIQYDPAWKATLADPQVADILGEGDFHTGNNKYGLNLQTAGMRYNQLNNDYINWVLGFRISLEKQRFDMWLCGDKTQYPCLELYGPGGFKCRPFYWTGNNQLLGLRLVKNN